MSLYSRMVIVLTSVALVSGALLVGVGMFTKERIAYNKQKAIEQAVIKVLPGTRFSQKLYEEKGFAVYEGKDENGQLLGYALNIAAGGFQDKIIFMLGINILLDHINSLYILDQKETPGLGAKITNEEAFLQFWENKACDQPLMLRKPPTSKDKLGTYEVNTITGATVSSEAVLDSINASLVKIKKLTTEGKLRLEGKNAE